ncbi:MAG TPA: prepilin-type N-terminal cleavage/methylation domain-containing protein [Tepidisphaeraceae bacterium]|jgi:prepilin-type N-terminal cleavage/methylation domain-containing protein|nr:prepilin-type N-terminal cleavage/methylation domain-containing protein [Tepidisphaeraceae bacterium]
MQERRGFTFVEILVVMGIIAILAALLLPVMNKVRQSTMQTRCLSNMRQLTAACLAYAMENEGQLPYDNWGTPTDSSVYGHGWMFSGPQFRTGYPPNSDLNGSWSGQYAPVDGVMTGVLWPYLKNLGVYHCPLDTPEFWVDTEGMSSYLCNGAQSGYGAVGGGSNNLIPGARLSRFTNNPNAVYFWEAQEQLYQNQSLTGAVWNDGASYPTEEVLSARHFKGANVSCFDGHVEWWDPGTWQFNASAGGPSRLWCSPYSSNGH